MVEIPHPIHTYRVPIREHVRVFGVDDFRSPMSYPPRVLEFTYVKHVRIMDEDIAVFDGEIV